jgi:hypothetical protein
VFLYRLVSKHFGKVIFSTFFGIVIYLMISTPTYETTINKVEFRKHEDKSIHYFYKIDGVYFSSRLDKYTWGTIFYDHKDNTIHLKTINAAKGLLILSVILLSFIQLVLVMSIDPYFDLSEIQRRSLIDICQIKEDDDGNYNFVAFGKSFCKIKPTFGKIDKSYISLYSAPTIWRLMMMKKFTTKSIQRNNKLSRLGI